MGLAVLTFVLASAPLDWDTICFGEDGHVAVEPALAGRCAASDGVPGNKGAPAIAPGLASSGAACCGPCTDVLTASAQWLERSPGKARDASPPAHAIAALPTWVAYSPKAPPSPAFATSAPLVRRSASSGTILRC